MLCYVGRQGSDVYFGTDVWGRGTFGGGGFDSYLVGALQTLHKGSGHTMIWILGCWHCEGIQNIICAFRHSMDL